MTVATETTERLLALVHDTGYWRVILHPTAFDARRIPSLKACWSIMEESRVRLRGWDYPHLDDRYRRRGSDWIESGSDFADQIEVWRFYQSGQFVHHFSVTEDREFPSLGWPRSQPSARVSGPRQLSFVEVIYTLTEVLEFTRNLAYRQVLEPAATLRVELHGMEDRQLVAPSNRSLSKRYRSEIDVICWERTALGAELLALAPDFAVDAAQHIFERFGWDDAPRAMIERDQRWLLERRF